MKDIDQIRQNLFPAAHESIWRAFPWHSGAHQPHSSQVLAIDVFGTVQNHPLCDSLASELVMTVFGAQMSDIAQQRWTVKLEFRVPADLFGEPRPTQLDVLLENNTAVVVLECKFTETGGGPCSQPPEQCNGRYEMQTNPKNDKRARCALTGKGVEYWRWIPRYFMLNSAQSYVPCPFTGPAYQYMRNLLVAGRMARWNKRRGAFGVVYVEGDCFPMTVEISDANSEWGRFNALLRSDCAVSVGAISYQALLELWCKAHPTDTTLDELTKWVHQKIERIEREATFPQ
jgi:hypothetical protein